MQRRIPWFEILLSTVFIGATLFAAFSDAYNLPNRWFIRDDAYYYFKVAQNISEGHGSTFDGLHATNGYHPLWLAICIPIFALARHDVILPLRVLAVVIGVLQAATAVLIFRLVQRAVSRPAAMLAASYWAFNTYILLFLYKTGVESGIALFMIVLLLYRLSLHETDTMEGRLHGKQLAGLAAISLLMVFARLDLIFFALIIGLWIVLRGSSARYLLPMDLLALCIAAPSAFIARLGFPAYYDAATSALILLGLSALLLIPAMYMLGLYSSPTSWAPLPTGLRLAGASIGSTTVAAGLLLVGGTLGLLPAFSKAVLAYYAVISSLLLFGTRAAAWLIRGRHTESDPQEPLAQLRAHWKIWLRDAWTYYGIIGGGLAAYMLWNRLAFGTFTPVSGQVKHWWGTFTHSIYGSAAGDWLTFFAVNPFSDFNAWAPAVTRLSNLTNPILYPDSGGLGNPRWQASFVWILIGASLLTIGILLLSPKVTRRAIILAALVPVLAGSWMQIIGYNITGYASPKEWYWLTEPLLLAIAGALIFQIVSAPIVRRWPWVSVLVWIFVAWYAGRGALGYWRDAIALNPYGVHPAGTAYSPIIPFLEMNTPPGAVIGMTGGGNVGYLMPSRTVVNMDGLINSYEYFQTLQSGTSAQFLYRTGMRYAFANPTILASNPYHGQYTGRIRRLVDWGGKDLLQLLPAPNQ